MNREMGLWRVEVAIEDNTVEGRRN